jgi:hypothetical protein
MDRPKNPHDKLWIGWYMWAFEILFAMCMANQTQTPNSKPKTQNRKTQNPKPKTPNPHPKPTLRHPMDRFAKKKSLSNHILRIRYEILAENPLRRSSDSQLAPPS